MFPSSEWAPIVAKVLLAEASGGGSEMPYSKQEANGFDAKVEAIFDIMIADIEIQAGVDQAIEEIVADTDRQQQLRLACRPSR